MDSPEQSPPPLYRYTAKVWVEKTYDIIATDDETLETAVSEELMGDGLDPDEFSLVRIAWTRTPQPWH